MNICSFTLAKLSLPIRMYCPPIPGHIHLVGGFAKKDAD